MKSKKKKSSLKFRPIFGPKLGDFEPKAWCPTCKRGGACLNFAYFSMQFCNPGDQKGGHGPMAPPKYAPASSHREWVNRVRLDVHKIVFVKGVRSENEVFDLWDAVKSKTKNRCRKLSFFNFKPSYSLPAISACGIFIPVCIKNTVIYWRSWSGWRRENAASSLEIFRLVWPKAL